MTSNHNKVSSKQINTNEFDIEKIDTKKIRELQKICENKK